MRIDRFCSFAFLLCFVFFLSPAVTHAGPVIRTGDTVTLKEDQLVKGDLYLLGGSVSSFATVEGDLYAIGAGVTSKGEIEGDYTVIAGTVDIEAKVTDDVRVVGGRVTISEEIKGDLAIFGGDVVLLPGATVDGDVLFYGGSLEVGGPVKGSILAKGERVRVDAEVSGDVTATAYTSLTFGSHANVKGGVTYRSPHEMIRAIESVIVGNVTRQDSSIFNKNDTMSTRVAPFFVLLFTSLALRFIFGRRIDEFLLHTLSSYGVHGVIGFGLLLAVPVATVLLFVSVVGFILGLGVLFFYLTTIIMAAALAPNLAGAFLSKVFHKEASHSMWWTSAGATLIFLASQLPIVGFVMIPLLLSIIAGGIGTKVYAYLK